MVEEIEFELERAIPVRDRRGGQPAWRHIKHHVPGMIEPGRLSQADLARDLRPEMQRGIGVLPGREGSSGQRRDWSCSRTTLASRFQLALIVGLSLGHLLYPWSADFKASQSFAPLFRCPEECLLKWRNYSSICKTLSKGQAPTPTPMETCNDPSPLQNTLSHRKSRTGDGLLSRSWRSAASYASCCCTASRPRRICSATSFPLLADRYHVVAPDLPGFGFTVAPDRQISLISFDNFAKVIEDFTDRNPSQAIRHLRLRLRRSCRLSSRAGTSGSGHRHHLTERQRL